MRTNHRHPLKPQLHSSPTASMSASATVKSSSAPTTWRAAAARRAVEEAEVGRDRVTRAATGVNAKAAGSGGGVARGAVAPSSSRRPSEANKASTRAAADTTRVDVVGSGGVERLPLPGAGTNVLLAGRGEALLVRLPPAGERRVVAGTGMRLLLAARADGPGLARLKPGVLVAAARGVAVPADVQ